MDVRAFVRDDEGALKLAGFLVVNAEIRLEGFVQLDAFWNVNERASAPASAVERAEFAIGNGDDGAEILPENVGEKLKAHIAREENDAFFLEFFQHVVIDDFRLILCRNAREILLLGFGDPELLERLFHRVRNLVPRGMLPFRDAREICEGIKIDILEGGAEIGEGHLEELTIRLEAEFEHPFRFALGFGDFAHHFFAQAFARRENGYVLVAETVFVFFVQDIRFLLAHEWTSSFSRSSRKASQPMVAQWMREGCRYVFAKAIASSRTEAS